MGVRTSGMLRENPEGIRSSGASLPPGYGL